VLRQRILTALVLVPLVIWGVLQTPNAIFALLFGVVALLIGVEWARLAGNVTPLGQAGYLLLVLLGMLLLNMLPAGWLHWLLLAVSGLWLVMTLWLLIQRRPHLPSVKRQPAILLLGLLLIPVVWQAVVQLHASAQGPALTLALLILIWLADSAAYFGGKRFGRIKLAPVVSPNKTYEGLMSALLAAVLWAAVMAWLDFDLPFLLLLGMALVTTLVSVTGDLFESWVKRRAGVKDSGKLLPGHGGIWDRLDSLVSAAPVFLSLIWLSEIAT